MRKDQSGRIRWGDVGAGRHQVQGFDVLATCWNTLPRTLCPGTPCAALVYGQLEARETSDVSPCCGATKLRDREGGIGFIARHRTREPPLSRWPGVQRGG